MRLNNIAPVMIISLLSILIITACGSNSNNSSNINSTDNPLFVTVQNFVSFTYDGNPQACNLLTAKGQKDMSLGGNYSCQETVIEFAPFIKGQIDKEKSLNSIKVLKEKGNSGLVSFRQVNNDGSKEEKTLIKAQKNKAGQWKLEPIN